MTNNRRINVKALVLGVLTDEGGSLVIGSILGVIIGIILAAKGVQQNEIQTFLHGPFVLIAGLIIGFGFTVLGGFVAGRVSKSYQVLHGGIVGFISVFFGLLFWTTLPLWYKIIPLITNIPFGMLGGRIAEITLKQK